MSTTTQPAPEVLIDVLISPMTEHDLLEVVEIEETSGLSRWGWNAYYAELQGPNSPFMLVARTQRDLPLQGPRIIGYIVARLVAGEIHINNVAVRVTFRRLGIGYALLKQILDGAQRKKAEVALLEVRAGNLEAQALYQKCGFRPVSRRRNYYSAPVEDALIMSVSF